MHLLLIEDDAEAARFLAKGLRESGYVVDIASDGREGLFRATEGLYDLIIADRQLPHFDGLSIVAMLRKNGKHTPVLILSATITSPSPSRSVSCWRELRRCCAVATSRK
jgi:two-component system OmpR family response regulator